MIESYSYLATNGTRFTPQEYQVLLNKVFITHELSSDQVPQLKAVTWKYQNRSYEYSTQSNGIPQLTKDQMGLVILESKSQSLFTSIVVLNPDKTERFRISPPKIILDNKNNECSYFYCVKYNEKLHTYECVFFDGSGQYTADLDIRNGNLSNIKPTRY